MKPLEKSKRASKAFQAALGNQQAIDKALSEVEKAAEKTGGAAEKAGNEGGNVNGGENVTDNPHHLYHIL